MHWYILVHVFVSFLALFKLDGELAYFLRPVFTTLLQLNRKLGERRRKNNGKYTPPPSHTHRHTHAHTHTHQHTQTRMHTWLHTHTHTPPQPDESSTPFQTPPPLLSHEMMAGLLHLLLT